MNLPEALGGALSARYGWAEPKRPATHTIGRQARMRRIMAAVGGSRKAAAAAAGIPYSTWGHLMGARRHASAANLRKIESAFARLVMSPAIAAKIAAKGYPKLWIVSAVVVADPRSRRYLNRKVDGPGGEEGWRAFKGEGLRGKRIVDPWLSLGDEAAAQALEAEVGRVYGGPWAFEGDHVGVELT